MKPGKHTTPNAVSWDSIKFAIRNSQFAIAVTLWMTESGAPPIKNQQVFQMKHLLYIMCESDNFSLAEPE